MRLWGWAYSDLLHLVFVEEVLFCCCYLCLVHSMGFTGSGVGGWGGRRVWIAKLLYSMMFAVFVANGSVD